MYCARSMSHPTYLLSPEEMSSNSLGAKSGEVARTITPLDLISASLPVASVDSPSEEASAEAPAAEESEAASEEEEELEEEPPQDARREAAVRPASRIVINLFIRLRPFLAFRRAVLSARGGKIFFHSLPQNIQYAFYMHKLSRFETNYVIIIPKLLIFSIHKPHKLPLIFKIKTGYYNRLFIFLDLSAAFSVYSRRIFSHFPEKCPSIIKNILCNKYIHFTYFFNFSINS